MSRFEQLLKRIPLRTEYILITLPFFLIFGDWRIASAFLFFVFLFQIKDAFLLKDFFYRFDNRFAWLLLLTWGAYVSTKSEFDVSFNYFSGLILIPMLLFLIIQNIVLNLKYVVAFFRLLFVSGVVLSIISLYILALNNFDVTIRIGTLWSDMNIVSAYFLFLFMFCFSFIINKRKGENVLFYIISLVILGIAIFLTQTRGVWLAMVFSFVIFYVRKPKAYIFAGLFFGIFFILFQDVIITRYLTVKNFGSDVSSIGRLQAWVASVILIIENPILGYGFDSFMTLRENVFYFYIVPVIHSHNTYLRTILEMGLVGFAIYFSFLFRALFYTFKLKKRNIGSEWYGVIDGLQLSFISMLVVFMFEPYFSLFGCSTIVIWLLISLSFKLYHSNLSE